MLTDTIDHDDERLQKVHLLLIDVQRDFHPSYRAKHKFETCYFQLKNLVGEFGENERMDKLVNDVFNCIGKSEKDEPFDKYDDEVKSKLDEIIECFKESKSKQMDKLVKQVVEIKNNLSKIDHSRAEKYTPSLCVNKADEHAKNVIKMIYENWKNITDITCTMDTHDINDISHSNFWKEDRHMGELYKAWVKDTGEDSHQKIGRGDDILQPHDYPTGMNGMRRANPDEWTQIYYLQRSDLTGIKMITNEAENNKNDVFLQNMKYILNHRQDKGESMKYEFDGVFIGLRNLNPNYNLQNVVRFWKPSDPGLLKYCQNYFMKLQQFQSKKTFKGADKCLQGDASLPSEKLYHTIWPYHCIQGSLGHAIWKPYHDAIMWWSAKTGKDVYYVLKAQNKLCEMYSAIRAEVPVEGDTTTYPNVQLLQYLRRTTYARGHGLVIAGQALGHCVQYTVSDIVRLINTGEEYMKKPEDTEKQYERKLSEGTAFTDPNYETKKKIVLLRDGAGPFAFEYCSGDTDINGSEGLERVRVEERVKETNNLLLNKSEDFLNDMNNRYIRVLKCEELFAPKNTIDADILTNVEWTEMKTDILMATNTTDQVTEGEGEEKEKEGVV
jgi:nicotinamidase-related amidase